MLKVRENILSSTIDPFNPKNTWRMDKFSPKDPANEWTGMVRRQRGSGIGRPESDTAVKGHNSRSIDTRCIKNTHHRCQGAPRNKPQVGPINQLLEENTDTTFMYRKGKRQDKLRAVANMIKMRRNRDISEYITKHRILRNDMVYAGCDEIIKDANKEYTVNYRVKGLRSAP